MTQIWQGEIVIPVTPVRFSLSKEDLTLKVGDKVRVIGISKGKGFQGVVKRHGFHGGPQTHGQKNRQRAPGSIGNTAAQRVIPGRRMAGHMGSVKINVKNLKVVELNPQERLVLLKGAVPGYVGGKVEIQK